MSLPETLRKLPDFDPSPAGWPSLSRRLDPSPRSSARRAPRLMLLAAASALLAIGLTLRMPQPDVVVGHGEVLKASAADIELLRLMERSRELEMQLARLRPQTNVWDSRLEARAQAIERGLTYVDVQLNYAVRDGRSDQARRLWSNRVELMTALVATHRNAHLAPGGATRRGHSI